MISLPARIRSIAIDEPNRIAIKWRNESISYENLDHLSTSIAHDLLRQGFSKHDRIGFCSRNSTSLLFYIIAWMKLGMTIVPVNYHYTSHEINTISKDSRIQALFISPEKKSQIQGLEVPLHTINVVSQKVDLEYDSFGNVVFYTSGTTGKPKGALLTMTNILTNLEDLYAAWEWTREDILVHALPLHHIHGFGVALMGALYKGCTIILKDTFDAADILTTIQHEKATMYMGTPTMYEFFVRLEETYSLKHARMFISGSAPLSAALHREFQRRYGHMIVERAGMSETMMNFTNTLHNMKVGTVGKPLPNVSVRIVDKSMQDVAKNCEGELLVKGPHVFKGYIGQDNEKYFHDGYFITGDIGKIDDDGFVTLVSRKDDVIISGGVNIYPKEIEEIICSMPGVEECTVVAMDDDLYGQVPQAFVSGSVSEETVDLYCQERLARFKIPKKISIIESIPRNAMGKIDRKKLTILS